MEEFKKPKLPESITLSTNLTDLTGIDLWFTSYILNLDLKLLNEPAKGWLSCVSYHSSLLNLYAFNIVINFVERVVKLSSDF